jgi:hypothetical protein
VEVTDAQQVGMDVNEDDRCANATDSTDLKVKAPHPFPFPLAAFHLAPISSFVRQAL